MEVETDLGQSTPQATEGAAQVVRVGGSARLCGRVLHDGPRGRMTDPREQRDQERLLVLGEGDLAVGDPQRPVIVEVHAATKALLSQAEPLHTGGALDRVDGCADPVLERFEIRGRWLASLHDQERGPARGNGWWRVDRRGPATRSSRRSCRPRDRRRVPRGMRSLCVPSFCSTGTHRPAAGADVTAEDRAEKDGGRGCLRRPRIARRPPARWTASPRGSTAGWTATRGAPLR